MIKVMVPITSRGGALPPPLLDVDECSSSPCTNGGQCINGVDGFTCACPVGFTGLVCETKLCFAQCNDATVALNATGIAPIALDLVDASEPCAALSKTVTPSVATQEGTLAVTVTVEDLHATSTCSSTVTVVAESQNTCSNKQCASFRQLPDVLAFADAS